MKGIWEEDPWKAHGQIRGDLRPLDTWPDLGKEESRKGKITLCSSEFSKASVSTVPNTCSTI